MERGCGEEAMFSVSVFDVVKNSKEIDTRREIAQNEINFVSGWVLMNGFMISVNRCGEKLCRYKFELFISM